jgi:hypothetical protein
MKCACKIVLYGSIIFLQTHILCWQKPITVTPEWNDSSVPWIACNDSGNATIVWRLYDGDYTRIQSSHCNTTLGNWSDALSISPAPHAREPQIVINNQGNAAAIWCLVGGSYFVTQASFYDASSGSWDLPFNLPFISAYGYDAEMPTIAFNNNNKAIACWQHYDGTTWRIQIAAGDSTGTWAVPVNVSLPNFYGFSPKIVMNNAASPFAAVVFYGIMQDGGNDCVQTVTSHDGGITWSAPIAISDEAVPAYIPQIVRDDNDDLLVVWQIKNNDGSWTVQARKLESGVWLAIKDLASHIELNDSRCPNVRIAGNAGGQACITWFTTVSGEQLVQATVYDASEWALWQPQIVDVSDTFAPINSLDWPNQRVAIDGSGNSIVVWQEPDNVGNLLIHAAVYASVATSWSSSILSEAGQDATLPFVALSSAGNGFAAWKCTNGLKLASPINQIQISQYP